MKKMIAQCFSMLWMKQHALSTLPDMHLAITRVKLMCVCFFLKKEGLMLDKKAACEGD